MKKGMFRASGTTGACIAVVGPEPGQIVAESVSYTCDAAGTLKFYRARQKTTAAAACSAATGLKISTDAAGKVGGAVLTTSDYVIIGDSSGTGFQVRSLSVVAAVGTGANASTVQLTLGATATCAAGDFIYIVRAADIHSLTTAQETKTNLLNLFNSYRRMPVAVELNGSTGSKFFSGTYVVED